MTAFDIGFIIVMLAIVAFCTHMAHKTDEMNLFERHDENN